MIVTQTPYRLSFFGGGTDYNSWFEKHGALVLAVGMARYCYLTIRRLPPFFEHQTRIVYSKIELINQHAEITHPSVKGCLEYLKINEGVEIHHDGDLPARSGIGSSSSFTVGLLHALYALKGQMVSSAKLAKEAIYVEQECLKEAVGIQDQIMAAYGAFRVLEMKVGGQWSVKNMVLPVDYLQSLESHILLGFSGISRMAQAHAQAQISNIKQGKTESELFTISSLAQEALTLFSQQADFNKIGALLDASWKLKRFLADNISAEWMDDLYDTALRSGAFGGKLMGAGGGGFFFFLAPPEKHQTIQEALPQIKVWVPFKIDYGGSQVIFYQDDQD